MIFGTLTSVVNLLLFGRAGSLPSGARILIGLREDFLRGVGKLTSFFATATVYSLS